MRHQLSKQNQKRRRPWGSAVSYFGDPLKRDLVALALHALAEQLAVEADRFRLLARPALGRLLVVTAHLHLAEDTLALHLLLERAQGLIDVVVTNENLQGRLCSPNGDRK